MIQVVSYVKEAHAFRRCFLIAARTQLLFGEMFACNFQTESCLTNAVIDGRLIKTSSASEVKK